MVPSAEQFARIDLPILTITGHYDDDQPGALEHYQRHMQHASPAARAKHYLVIGPWDHAGTRTPQKQVGGLLFGDRSLVDLDDLHRQWYDWTLKHGTRPAFLEQHVAYYVVGADRWKYAESLASVASERLVWYLSSSAGRALDLFAAGDLVDQPVAGTSAPDRFVYDPLDTSAADLETTESDHPLTDQRALLALSGNGLVYHSARFAHDAELSGQMRLTLWIELDVPDTDLAATVYEVLGDGSQVMLAHDQVRARHRLSLRTAQLVTAGRVERYEFTAFNFTSRLMQQGSRLRLLVTCPNSIFAQKNYNGGGVVAEESGRDARTAHVLVYHDALHQSALELPIGR
ncbi:MAG: CocE/NonD family hydrolase [Planctomycetota bacterium]